MYSLPRFGALLLCLSLFIFAGCSKGPSGPEPGSPAFFRASAKQTFAAGDFLKTNEHLDKALKSSEFKATGLPWGLLVNSGLAHGYMEIADSFELGARANKTSSAAFRKQVNDDRRFARGMVLQFAERFQEFRNTVKDDPVKLAFPVPDGTTAPVMLLGRVGTGVQASPQQIEEIHKGALQRAVILEVSRATGSGDDATKARPLFSSGEASVPRADFLYAMASSLHDLADLYSPKKLDEPDQMKMMCQQALDTLKTIPESQKTKDLAAKIEKTMKAPRAAS